MYHDCGRGDCLSSCNRAGESVAEQRSTKAVPRKLLVDRKPAEQYHRNWIWHAIPYRSWRI